MTRSQPLSTSASRRRTSSATAWALRSPCTSSSDTPTWCASWCSLRPRYTLSGVHPGLMDGFAEMKPEMMFGSPWHEEYLRIAPRPEDFTVLFEKKTQMDRELQDFSAEAISAITAPTLLIIGDSDLVRPEHAVEMFRLLGGGVFGDTSGRHARLAAGCSPRHLARDAGGPRRPAARDHPGIS